MSETEETAVEPLGEEVGSIEDDGDLKAQQGVSSSPVTDDLENAGEEPAADEDDAVEDTTDPGEKAPAATTSVVQQDEALTKDKEAVEKAVSNDEDMKQENEVLEASASNSMMDEKRAVSPSSPVPMEETTEVAVSDNPVDDMNQDIFYDHFTLPSLSTDVRFRATNRKVRVYSNYNSQLLMEESLDNDRDGQRKITVKKVGDGTTGLRALRAIYTLVCVFFTGFLIVLFIQLLLFLVLDVTVEFGATEVQDIRGYAAVGTMLAIPLYIWGMSSALVIAGHFIGDAWHGHALVKRFVFGRFKGVLTEWVSFFVFLGIPIFAMCFALLARSDNWWAITAMVWFCCVAAFYVVFAITVVYFEVQACLEYMRDTYDEEVLELLQRAIFLRQQYFYSGTRSIRYVARGYMEDASKLTEEQKNRTQRHETISLYTRFTQWDLLEKQGLFTKLDEPARVYDIEDTQDVRPYVTANSWSLEKIYCRTRDSRYVAITKGKGALTKAQLKSSFVCAILGNILTLLVMISLLVWLQLGTGALIAILVVMILFCALPSLKASISIYRLARGLIQEIEPQEEKPGIPGYSSGSIAEDTTDAEGGATINEAVSSNKEGGACEGIYAVHETYRVTLPTEIFCWIMLAIETVLGFIYPAICLFEIGNYSIAIIFVIIGGFTLIRNHLNAGLVLEVEGNMNSLTSSSTSKTWQKRSRLNTIVSNISRSRSRSTWVSVLFFFVILLTSLFAFAVVNDGTEGVSSKLVTPVQDYKYLPQEDLEYPTCSFGKGLSIMGISSTDMVDYVYVSLAAYQTPNITQKVLDDWFGPGVAIDEQGVVDEFRQVADVASPVSFKLIYFPENKHGLLAIRGTIDPWDALADAQLWGSAAIFQGLRFVLPFGEVWNPILDNLVKVISWLESSSIGKVAFYRDTTKFVEYLKRNESSLELESLQITGHSLGGGLAIITGAQTGTPTVAVSGPNAKLSRLSFSPKLSLHALNTKVFNIVPDRDIVPRLDDRARLSQEIRCTAPLNSFAGCHDAKRTLCEVMYTCGTGDDRPVICECNKLFGYDAPIPINDSVNVTFEEACKHVEL